jgi:hypothetical protein
MSVNIETIQVSLLHQPAISKEYRFCNGDRISTYRIVHIDDDGVMGKIMKVKEEYVQSDLNG